MVSMRWTLLKTVDYFRGVLQVIQHYFLALIYMFSKSKVPPIRNPILRLSATKLAKRIREGELTSESVVQAYIERILEVEPFINSVVDCRFDEALKEAREADSLVTSKTMTKEALKEKKPLLGVPFSTKVLITVKGLRSTAGSVIFKDVRAQDDAVTVTLMKKAGAIALVNTNSSEVGLNFQTINNLHGTTCNPYDTSKTSGGSSGGESALLGAAGSVIGLGNDLAGSIRLPCMFTGLFGHKPSRGLVSNYGCFPVLTANLNKYLSTGPMCRYAEDLVTMMKILSTDREKSVQFGKKVDFKDVKVYYLQSLGDIPLVDKVDEEIVDAVNKVVSHFQLNQGSKTKEVTMPLEMHFISIFAHLILSAIPNLADCVTAGKAKVDAFQELFKLLSLQSKHTFGFIAILMSSRIPMIYNPNSVEYYEKLLQQLDDYLNNLLLDDNSVLIMPTIPFAAPYHHEILLSAASTCYTSIFNILGMPGTQCPVSINKNGLPIGVQILSRRGNDHLTVACALELEKAFGGWKQPTNNLERKYRVLKARK